MARESSATLHAASASAQGLASALVLDLVWASVQAHSVDEMARTMEPVSDLESVSVPLEGVVALVRETDAGWAQAMDVVSVLALT